MTRDLLLPDSLRADVVRVLYADANELGWATLGPQEKTRAFNRWIDDPRVGGRLTGYMSPEQARVWIKDGPMKEYARAMRGTGRFAEFGRQGGTSSADVVTRALGQDATIQGKIGTKPLQCTASTGDGSRAFVVLGDAANFKNLVWAALRGSIQHDIPGHVVVLEPPGAVTSSTTAEQQRGITDRCGLGLHHLRELLGTMTPEAEE